jgi:ubiquinone/menaquinone biosynthesis C-methylase UbiE
MEKIDSPVVTVDSESHLKLSKEETTNLNAYSSLGGVQAFTKIGLWREEAMMIRKYFKKNRAKALDLGCGAGRTTLPLSEMGYDVIGMDVSEQMIEKAKSRFPSLDFRIGDACDLKFPDKSFDYVLFSFNGIDYIYPEEKRTKALKEINRVLKDDGIFIFSTHNPVQPVTRGVSSCIHHWYWLLKFVLLNIIRRRLFSKYKIEKDHFGELITYYITPHKQKIQLESNGFRLLETTGRFNNKMKYFEPWLYYVSQKINNLDEKI